MRFSLISFFCLLDVLNIINNAVENGIFSWKTSKFLKPLDGIFQLQYCCKISLKSFILEMINFFFLFFLFLLKTSKLHENVGSKTYDISCSHAVVPSSDSIVFTSLSHKIKIYNPFRSEFTFLLILLQTFGTNLPSLQNLSIMKNLEWL